jgi:hypothetical protein|tara:strand:+ start:1550 stop:1669 length:120 start_codon:yes stop_codon:yes gene_type:complete
MMPSDFNQRSFVHNTTMTQIEYAIIKGPSNAKVEKTPQN